MKTILLIICASVILYAQNKTEFGFTFEGDRWYHWVMEDTVTRNPDGSLVKRSDGTYLHLKLINGKLQAVTTYRNTGWLKPRKYTVME